MKGRKMFIGLSYQAGIWACVQKHLNVRNLYLEDYNKQNCRIYCEIFSVPYGVL